MRRLQRRAAKIRGRRRCVARPPGQTGLQAAEKLGIRDVPVGRETGLAALPDEDGLRGVAELPHGPIHRSQETAQKSRIWDDGAPRCLNPRGSLRSRDLGAGGTARLGRRGARVLGSAQ